MRLPTGGSVWVRTLIYWGPVALYAGLIFYLSAQSHPDEKLPSFLKLLGDKVLHAVEYAGLGGLCYRAFRWGMSGAPASQAVWCAIVAASLYGATDEVHQLFVPFRESSWQDWVADVTGAGSGGFIARRLLERFVSAPLSGGSLPH
jgi:VanZ family protein